MKKKPDISTFLSNGAAAAAENADTSTPRETAVPLPDGEKITKTIRMTKSLERRLKEEAHHRTMAKGRRVTESDLIEEALLKYLNK